MVRIKHMELDVKFETTELAPEGVHAATVDAIESIRDTKCVIRFKVEAESGIFVVDKVYPAELAPKSPLWRDVQLLLGRSFNAEDKKQKFKLESIIGKPCRVLVQHKQGRGKMKASVESVLETEKSTPPPPKAEAVEKKEGAEA